VLAVEINRNIMQVVNERYGDFHRSSRPPARSDVRL